MAGEPRRKVSLRIHPDAHTRMEQLAEQLACDVSVAYRATLAVGAMHQGDVAAMVKTMQEVG